jgi:hypothetical protein
VELTKALRLKIRMAKKDELRELWDKYGAECRALSDEIQRCDDVVNLRVYEIYGLSSVEIDVVESSLTAQDGATTG